MAKRKNENENEKPRIEDVAAPLTAEEAENAFEKVDDGSVEEAPKKDDDKEEEEPKPKSPKPPTAAIVEYVANHRGDSTASLAEATGLDEAGVEDVIASLPPVEKDPFGATQKDGSLSQAVEEVNREMFRAPIAGEGVAMLDDVLARKRKKSR